MSEKPISPLRRRMIEDMTVRNFVEKTRNDYIGRKFSDRALNFPGVADWGPDDIDCECCRCRLDRCDVIFRGQFGSPQRLRVDLWRNLLIFDGVGEQDGEMMLISTADADQW
jgi:hypothetical protein